MSNSPFGSWCLCRKPMELECKNPIPTNYFKGFSGRVEAVLDSIVQRDARTVQSNYGFSAAFSNLSLRFEYPEDDQVVNRDGIKEEWIYYNYEKFPLVASLAKITKIQADIRSVEYEILNSLVSKTKDRQLSFDSKSTLLETDRQAYYTNSIVDAKVVVGNTDSSFKPDDVDLKIRMKAKTSGKMRIKYLPSGSTVLDLRAFVKEFEIQQGCKVDALCIDYMDLMMPKNKRVSPSDLFVKDKYVSEELRNLAVELQILFVTASQLNRGAVEEIEFDHSHIAGGLSKIQTADNVIGIFTSRAMRERGRYQIQFMKTRSSSGVGQKVDLEFDIDTLRIRDLSDDEEYEKFSKQRSTIYDKMKRSSEVSPADTKAQSDEDFESSTLGKVRGKPEGSKLRQLISEIDMEDDDD